MESNKIILNYTVKVLPGGSTYTQIEQAVKKMKETKEKELFDLDMHCKFEVKVNVEMPDSIAIGFRPYTTITEEEYIKAKGGMQNINHEYINSLKK
jgi:hypothetical protein